MTSIYLDHNATSPPSAEHFSELFLKLKGLGNPSSPHAHGRAASVALTQARRRVSQLLGVDSSQLIFTSGATEANNLVILGSLRLHTNAEVHVITSGIEHPAVLEPLQHWAQSGQSQLTVLSPNSEGVIRASDVIQNIQPNTRFIALMAANNEVGSMQPVKIIGDFLHYKRWGAKSGNDDFTSTQELEQFLSPHVSAELLQKVHFHVDAVQTFAKVPRAQWFSPGIDSCAVSGHKIGALQGAGVLFLQRGRKLQPLLFGGAQEKNRRAGTENLPGIVSLGMVCDKILQDDEKWWQRIAEMDKLRSFLCQELKKIPQFIINSPQENCLPNTVHISVQKTESTQKNGEDFLLELDMQGICASSGSACSSGANLPSKVLLSMGRSPELAKNSIRFSLSPNTSLTEITTLIRTINQLV